ncbi:MAG: gliding motility protein GldN [Bacteroidales bacterium]|jgi:gliding motility associated protien GldN|nr:gliding motility protein GldN [Bacteroidales bacterium]
MNTKIDFRLLLVGILLTTFGVSFSQAQVLENAPPLDNFYEKINFKDRQPRPDVFVRDADVYMKNRIWRTIDFRAKMNQYLYYPIEPVQDRVSLMSLVLKGMEDGTIIAYDPITDDFTKQLTYEEFLKQNTSEREIQKEDLDNPGEYITTKETTSFRKENVKMLRVKEDWFIDKHRSVRDVRILGIAPVIQQFDNNNELKGNQTLFWLYYKQIRPEFARTESFNRHNSAMRPSYDDVFSQDRLFESYITKMDNMQDRSIQSYAQGVDIMYEAERMKDILFKMEHDLWSF